MQEKVSVFSRIAGVIDRGFRKLTDPPKSEVEWARRVTSDEIPSESDMNSYVLRRRTAINMAQNHHRTGVSFGSGGNPLIEGSDLFGLRSEQAMLDRNDPDEIIPAMRRDAKSILDRTQPTAN